MKNRTYEQKRSCAGCIFGTLITLICVSVLLLTIYLTKDHVALIERISQSKTDKLDHLIGHNDDYYIVEGAALKFERMLETYPLDLDIKYQGGNDTILHHWLNIFYGGSILNPVVNHKKNELG